MDIGTIGDAIDGYTFTVRKLNDKLETRWCCDVSDSAGRIVRSACAYRPDDAVRHGMEIAYHDAIKREQEARENRGS